MFDDERDIDPRLLNTVAGMYEDEDEFGDFIVDDEPRSGGEEAEPRRPASKPDKKRSDAVKKGFAGAAMKGISKDTWHEINEIFGDTTFYDWALEVDDDTAQRTEQPSLRDVRSLIE